MRRLRMAKAELGERGVLLQYKTPAREAGAGGAPPQRARSPTRVAAAR